MSSNRILVIGSSPNERFAYSEAAVSWHFVPTVEAADRWLADEDAKVEQVVLALPLVVRIAKSFPAGISLVLGSI